MTVPIEERSESAGEETHEYPGRGVVAHRDGRTVVAGNDLLLHEQHIDHPSKVCEVIGTVVHVGIDGAYAGHILISDEIRGDAKQAVQDLRGLGVDRITLLTGDEESAARSVSDALGLDGFDAGLLPHEKVERMESLGGGEKTGHIAFVGDGINDAAVIAGADIGVAMGGHGSDAAVEVADVVLMSDQPMALVEAIRVSHRTGRIVLQNIIFALAVKAAFVALGVAGVAGMWAAVVADMGVALAAIANATRARR